MGMIVPSLAHWLEASELLNGKGMFMTGTDTNVGKTWVGKQLIHTLRVLGREVIPRKPVESGWNADIQQTDAWQLANAAGLELDNSICPYRFSAAISPPRAAHLVGKHLTLQTLAATCPTRWDKRQFLYVEGAGGFYSPIADDGLNADLAQILGLPVVLVAENKLGCINHVLLAAEAIQQRRVPFAGVILNNRQSLPESMDNLNDLRAYLTVPVVTFPAT
ncbi:MAG: dethiobiotin synthase [Pseudomonadota bacterium]|jgi:dethiobiotin synthetase|uniref:ATP-dependent dethiobiotin synthetase BioD n=1 Tax=Thiothrix fructosivorans TaxID=111770 RepID=A0A8B0SML4_9GAMM|nr:dethiobiotin synthase [Thiothrix fructosivorans]MBO0612126.1 dethiobiotin synthase [Thiothrix fructosivorans]QTX12375.1 dethiobiotin synthase [Thiothrix fructosivorans]